jgi:hypothetical protein
VTPSIVIWVGRADDEELVAEAEDADEAVESWLRTLEGMSLARMLERTLEGREVRTEVGLAVEAPEGNRLVGRLLRMLEMTPDGSSVRIPLGSAVEKGKPEMRLVLLAPRIPEATLEGMSLARMLESTLEGSEVRTEVGLAPEGTPEGKMLVGRLLRMLEMTPEGSSVKMLVGSGTVEKGTPGMRLVLPAPRTPETTLDKTPEGKSLRMLETTPVGNSVRMPVGMTEGTLPRMLETTPVGKSDKMLEMIPVGKSVKMFEGSGTVDRGRPGRVGTPVAPRTPETTLDTTPVGKSPRMLETTLVGSSVRMPVGITEGTLPRMLDTTPVGRPDRMLEMMLVGKSVRMPEGRGRSEVTPRTLVPGRSLGRLPSTLDTMGVGRADRMLEISLGRSVVGGRLLRVLTMLEMTPEGSAPETSEGKLVTTDRTLDATEPTAPVGLAMTLETTAVGSEGRSLERTDERSVATAEGKALERTDERSDAAAEGKSLAIVARTEEITGPALSAGRVAAALSATERAEDTALTALGARPLVAPPMMPVATDTTLLMGKEAAGRETPRALAAPMNCKPAAPRATIL